MRCPGAAVAVTLAAAVAGVAGADEASSPSSHVLVFLAEDRPVFLRLKVTAGEKPFDEAWPGSLKALVTCLDRDNDGKLSTKEADKDVLAALVRLATGGVTALPAVAPNGGTVSAEALADALRPSLGPFKVQVGRVANGRTDALFDQLDRDKDGQLTRSELGAIAGSLRRLDFDDNEMISADELEPFNDPALAARVESSAERRGRFSALPPVVEVVAGESSLRLVRLLLRKYDKGPERPDNKLSHEEFAIDPEGFAKANRNHDGSLDLDELKRFLAGGPIDLVLDVAFPETATGRTTTKAAAGSVQTGVQVRQVGDGDVEFAVGTVRLDIHVDGGEAATGNARRVISRRFQAADANKDGYLDGKELTGENAAGSPLAGLVGVADRDGDGKLYAGELNEFIDRQLAAAGGRLTVTTSDQGRAIFGILDLDRDRRLGAREVMRTVERVTSWDRDGDGKVSADEIPYHFRVTIARGELAGLGGDSLGVVVAPRATGVPRPEGSTAGPEWFRKMDRNRDGDVSRREFLGPRESFDRLDRDKDGLIDPEEAGAAETGRSR